MITHNFLIHRGSLLDYQGSNSITLTGSVFQKTEKGMALYFDGIDDKAEFGSLGNVKSLVFVVYLATDSEEIFEGDPNEHKVYASSGTLSYADFDNAYVDGVDTDAITPGWHVVAVTSSTDVNCTDAVLALNNASYGKIKVLDVEAYDNELTSDEVVFVYDRLNKDFSFAQSKDNFYYHDIEDVSNEDGIVTAWNMVGQDGEIIDLVGSNDLTDNGTNDYSGIFGRGRRFYGRSGSYLTRTINSTLQPSEITVCFWIKQFDRTIRQIPVSCHDAVTADNKGGYLFNIYETGHADKGKLSFQAGNGTDWNPYGSVISTTALDLNKWYFVAGTISASEMAVWINASKETTTTGFSLFAQSANPFVIGGHDDLVTSRWFNGIMCQFRIYNKALSQLEMNRIYNAGMKQIMFMENFSDEPADSLTTIPIGWKNGTTTASIKELTTSTRYDLNKGSHYLEFAGAGTMAYNVDLEDCDGYVEYDYYNGASWTRRTGLLGTIVGVSYASNILTFTGAQAGDGIANITIKRGALV